VTMNEKDFDLAVLGAGPGGYAAAIRGAQLGKKVALIEKEEIGGVCLNKGCIPTKTFLEYVETLENLEKNENWGIDLEVKGVNFQKFIERCDKTVGILVGGLNKIILSYGIELYRGEGSFIDRNRLEVKESKTEKTHRLKASKIIIASGSRPKRFAPFDIDDKNIITSDGALDLKEIPKDIVIIGGGVIGCEFASIFSGLGSKVILVELEKSLLPQEDREISNRLAAIFKRRNIEINLGTTVEGIDTRKGSLSLALSNGNVLTGEKVLVSLGRFPNFQIKGLEKIDLELGQGTIKVDSRMETSLKGIYAVGDVLGGPFLAHLAYHQGIIASENAFGLDAEIDRDTLPDCIYTSPEIGRVGLTEEEAVKRGMKIKVGRYPFAALSRAVIANERQGLFKIISREENDRIIGIHILGKRATDLIGEAVLALKSGMTAKDLAGVIHAHPTFYEGLGSAAEDVNHQAIHLRKK